MITMLNVIGLSRQLATREFKVTNLLLEKLIIDQIANKVVHSYSHNYMIVFKDAHYFT